MNIQFSPPDITDVEINEVVDTLKSGWLTTGPKTKKFENLISMYTNTDKTVCLNSATAALELTLRLLGVGEGDEVITSAYTYTASASVIEHVGAKIILVDTEANSYHMDLKKMENLINSKTKVIIPVDIAGVMCDYDAIMEILNNKKDMFESRNEIQKQIGRITVLADAAHSFGAKYNGKKSGEVADFTCFSFHAVKNLTTGEGGAVTWKDIPGISNEDIYKEYMLLSLHGQSKDALEKTRLGSWEYDIAYPAYKCNMTDIMAAIGLGQFKRYPQMLSRRKEIVELYNNGLAITGVSFLNHFDSEFSSSAHLYLIRLLEKDQNYRNSFIELMSQRGIATNVHYKPLPLHSAYQKMGFKIEDFPNALGMYENGVSLPLHTRLTNEEVEYIIDSVKECLEQLKLIESIQASI
ncbi:DegT/DnrJ/EryC1/StrS family aminotransferase [Paenibacillus sp. FSL R7-0337]|uniref:DegT/DnrJ/EryC1/StrS family aminotransferase n=1 Tax=Paenibacillus sp. FSL R7-0337 TaxID=1926588 RepID=UPI00096C7071|nr:DegT/DnrJ/EryC1/StrS family aminotransferase [Paenibacillus sp. FSL R7-0337]OMF90354.1 capsular biosynthesis protein [Paenibacillus sp. FSL R7-0337]